MKFESQAAVQRRLKREREHDWWFAQIRAVVRSDDEAKQAWKREMGQ